MAEKILIVDDDPTTRDVISGLLTRERYEVSSVGTGMQALAAEARDKPGLIVLDLILPDLDGVDVCRRLRQQTSTPILIVSARSDVVDKVVGLEVGADDYLTKPFGGQEFVARVKAVLRRADKRVRQVGEESALDFGEIKIDRARHEVRVRGESRRLTRKEFDLLCALAANAGRVMSTTALLRDVWDCPTEIESRTVDVHIGRVRAKIEADRRKPKLIVTVPRVGYKFVPPSASSYIDRHLSAPATSELAAGG